MSARGDRAVMSRSPESRAFIDVLDRRGRRVTTLRGGEPSWSPDGRTLAFSRAGVVYVRRLGERRARRLSPGGGHAPVWSPDGRSLVFIGRGGGAGPVFRIRRDGRKLRNLGLHGRRVDWGVAPRPAPTGCRARSGHRTLASTAAGAVYERRQPAGKHQELSGKSMSLLVCLAADGRLRQARAGVSDSFGSYAFTPTLFQITPPHVLWVERRDNRYQDSRAALRLFDARRGITRWVDEEWPPGGHLSSYFYTSSFTPTTQLLLDEWGTAAWLVRFHPNGTEEADWLGVHDADGPRILEQAPARSITSLTLNAGRLTWTRNGANRSAAVRGLP